MLPEIYAPRSKKKFAPFDLKNLLKTVFAPKSDEKICIMMDLEDPNQLVDLKFLDQKKLSPQYYGYTFFYQGLHQGVMEELSLKNGDLFAYKSTGGSNLDLPETGWTLSGKKINFFKDLYPNYDIILCISTYSATAPLTALAKQFHFRGATLHGMNELVLRTGLAVDYKQISKETELLRQKLNRASLAQIDFAFEGRVYTLQINLDYQEAQKSHGICHKKGEIANLPAGEIYYVPKGAEGKFPMQYHDGSIALMDVHKGRIQKVTLLSGNKAAILEHEKKLQRDSATGHIGELGVGTQDLPFASADIQDEKILGTVHVATGRNDHLGGELSSRDFTVREDATHDDILYAPFSTPKIGVPQVRMYWNDRMEVLMENYEPCSFMTNLEKVSFS